MDQQDVIGIIELSSIIIAGGLGIASAVTETKDTKGKLTKWGMIAVAGIIITNSFSFIQSYLKQQQDAHDQVVNMRKEMIKDSIEKEKYIEQMGLLYANIHKSDSALKQQFKIQTQTSNVLTQVDKSIDVQNSIFKQSELLNEQQLKAADNIDRTLNPLFPFKVDLTFKVMLDSHSKELALITELLNQNTKDLSSYELFKQGYFEVQNEQGKFLAVTSESKDYAGFMSMLVRQAVSMTFSKKQNNTTQEIVCELQLDYLKERNKLNDAVILYNKKDRIYIISIKDAPLKVSAVSGKAFNSTKDLINSKFKLAIIGAPGHITASQLNFKFPPDFSKISTINNNGKGINSPSKELSTYNYYYTANSIDFTK